MYSGIITITKNGQLYLVEHNTFTRCGKNCDMGLQGRTNYSRYQFLMLVTDTLDQQALYYNCSLPADWILVVKQEMPWEREELWDDDVSVRLCMHSEKLLGPISIYGIVVAKGIRVPQTVLAFKSFDPPIEMTEQDIYTVSYCRRLGWE